MFLDGYFLCDGASYGCCFGSLIQYAAASFQSSLLNA